MSPNLARTHWRVSARTNGANTCVEASTDGALVWVRNSTMPNGPTLTVPADAWLRLLDQVAAGRVHGAALRTPVRVGPLTVSRRKSGTVELRATTQPAVTVPYTLAEWDVFVTGVSEDGEFSLPWLLNGDATLTT